jgi:hypothetical protein
MLAQPSGSWKLRAMSVPFCSVHTINVSVANQHARPCVERCAPYLVASGSRRPWRCASPAVGASGRPRTGRRFSPLLPVVAQVSRAQCDNCRPRRHHDIAGVQGIAGGRGGYTHDNASAEAGAPVEPVIVLELVYLDALAIVGRWRYQCHSRNKSLHALQAGKHALWSEARDRDALRRAGGRRAACGGDGRRWGFAQGRAGGWREDRRLGGRRTPATRRCGRVVRRLLRGDGRCDGDETEWLRVVIAAGRVRRVVVGCGRGCVQVGEPGLGGAASGQNR